MFRKKKKQAVSVISLRRRPGQSLGEEFEKLIDDRLMPIIFVPAVVWILVIVAIVQSVSNHPLSVRVSLGLAIVATGVSVIAFRRLIPQGRALVRGERGERAVAQQLDEL